MSGAAVHSADRHRDSPRLGRTRSRPAWAAAAVLERWVPRSRKSFLSSFLSCCICCHDSRVWLLKWIMIECPSITFSRCGSSGSSRLGGPHAAPSCSPVRLWPCVQYNLCSLKIYILSILHSKLFGMSPCGEQHSFSFIQKQIKTFLKMKKTLVSNDFIFSFKSDNEMCLHWQLLSFYWVRGVELQVWEFSSMFSLQDIKCATLSAQFERIFGLNQ